MNKSRLETFMALVAEADPTAYNAASHYGVIEWARAIGRRVAVRRMARDASEDAERAIAGLLAHPINEGPRKTEHVYEASVNELAIYEAWGMRGVIEEESAYAAACREEDDAPGVPFESPYPQGSEAHWQALLAFCEEEKVRDAPRQELLWAPYSVLTTQGPVTEPEHAYLRVNLQAPDDVILQDFNSWLASARRRPEFASSPVKRFSPAELSRWAQNRVLMYLDLTVLADFLGVEVPNHVLGAAMFPDMEVDATEKVRKTVAPLARELTEGPFLEALAAAANAKRRSRPEGE